MTWTVPTEACQAAFAWTGVQTGFPCGFPALDPTHLQVTYTNTASAITSNLALGLHYTVLLDPLTGNATVDPLAMPDNGPGTVTVTRSTPAVQGTQFQNLESYQADALTNLYDADAMRDAELKRRVAALEAIAIGTPPAPNPTTPTYGIRNQRSIAGAGDLPIRVTDSILNINSATDLTPALPNAATRGGAPLMINIIAGSHLQTVLRSGADTIDGQTTFPAGAGTSTDFLPLNDGVNGGWKAT
jgi:hypothetical protein